MLLLMSLDSQIRITLVFAYTFRWSYVRRTNFIGEDVTMMSNLGARPYGSPGLPCKPNPKLDLYAMGIIFFKLLQFFTSAAPGSQRVFAMQDLREKQEFPPNFPDSERDLIVRLMKEEPSERLDLEEVINELEMLSSAEMK
ncbi:spindle assembly checkpoint kinase isoform X1 [Ziziphus jujuba]|uniref:Spindle assembly checkpoint kinase isoform X1 n=1 Tax=Ziziphus jujuba TaxID=326968 RepID=A0ABM3IBF4_ZIZJJ|nr:spindle assembly checkpoint kinase isoform X1 [Ziziphus jujuba]